MNNYELLTEEIDVDDSENHEDCKEDEENLKPFLHLATVDNGIEIPLLETCNAIFVFVMRRKHSKDFRL